MHIILSLLPLLQRTASEHLTDVRVVCQASDLHKAANSTDKFLTLDEINTDIGSTKLYSRSKLGLVLLVRALNRRIEKGELGFKPSNSSVYVNATHPGAVSTDQQKQMEDAYGTIGHIAVKVLRPLMSDPIDHGMT
jgi:WW domain-containing oxidoreductase